MSNCYGLSAHSACIECDVPQLSRNHFFTGKLLVERDFTDEQRYFMGKDRRHNRDLHGSGTACGLRVKQHTDPLCRGRYVLIEPGLAIDCCGREIVVAREEPFDFRTRLLENWQKQYGQDTPLGDEAHTLQICVRYRECPTEDVPAFFDECNSADVACQPNRILEGFEFDVLIDPPPEASDPVGVRLEWFNTKEVARAHRLALDDEHERLYVLSSEDPASLFLFSTENFGLVRARSIDGRVMDMVLSADGERLYVSLERNGLKVLVFPASLEADALNTLTLPGGDGEEVRLTAAPDGRLYALNINNQRVYAWNAPDADGASERLETPQLGTDPRNLAVAPDGSLVFVANRGSADVSVIDAADLSAAPHTIPISGAAPSALALAGTTAGQRLFVADMDNRTVHLFAVQPGAPDPFPAMGRPLTLPADPLEIVPSTGGRWLYALMVDAAGKGSMQVIDVNKLQVGEPDALGENLPLAGVNPHDLAISHASRRLYVALHGAQAEAGAGAVVILSALQQPCKDLFLRALDACPECSDGSCVVLSTILDFVDGQELTDARIDNLAGRRLLPSTSLITEVVKCLLEQGGAGEPGEQGPPGTPGKDGKDGEDGEDGLDGAPGLGIDKVTATFPKCTQNGSATITGDPPNRTLVLEIPTSAVDRVDVETVPCDQPGSGAIVTKRVGRQQLCVLDLKIPSLCDQKLAKICALNWNHGADIPAPILQVTVEENSQQRTEPGLLIAFDPPVLNGDIDTNTCRVFTVTRNDVQHTDCWCEVLGQWHGGRLQPKCDPNGVLVLASSPGVMVTGAWFKPIDLQLDDPHLLWPGRYRVAVNGDFIRDKDGKALDADHLLATLPTGDGVQGGTFESWFTVI